MCFVVWFLGSFLFVWYLVRFSADCGANLRIVFGKFFCVIGGVFICVVFVRLLVCFQSCFLAGYSERLSGRLRLPLAGSRSRQPVG